MGAHPYCPDNLAFKGYRNVDIQVGRERGDIELRLTLWKGPGESPRISMAQVEKTERETEELIVVWHVIRGFCPPPKKRMYLVSAVCTPQLPNRRCGRE
jgi:hypothetical protein